MSRRFKKDTPKVTLEKQIKDLQDEIKQKDLMITEQITNTQLALCEIFESVVNPIV